MEVKIERPVPFTLNHNVDHFDSTSPDLDNWLKKRAFTNEGKSSRTYVICVSNNAIGYYSLAAGSVSHEDVIGKLKRKMPSPIPVMILGRLAVHKDYQGRGLGNALLKDAILRTLQASEIIGIRAVLVHATNEAVSTFYKERGFKESPINKLTLMLPIEEISYNLPD